MDLDLRQLEVFCRVVELGSFSRAAADVHLAQASVSGRIASLEQAVGTRLLDRLSRSVVPTSVGRRLYQRALELLKLRDEIRDEMHGLLASAEGDVVVGASTIPGEYLLPEAIARFRALHKRARVSVRVADSQVVLEQVGSGEVEVGVVGSLSELPHLESQVLWRDELIGVVPAGHGLAERASVSLADLVSQPFVTREQGSGTRRVLSEAISRAKLTLEHVVSEMGSTTAIKEAVRAGLGVSIISARALDNETRNQGLCSVPIRPQLRRAFYLVRDRRRAPSPLCSAFVNSLTDLAGVELALAS